MKNIIIILFLTSAVSAQTTYYISSSGGNDANNGTSSSTPWKTLKSFTAGNRYLFKRGDTIYKPVKKLTTTTASNRVYIGAYGSGNAYPVFSGYSTIKPSAWVLTSTNVWKATLVSTNVTGFMPDYANCGILKVNGILHGVRRGKLSGLNEQWQFYCNDRDVYVYSVGNPGLLSTDIQISNGNLGGTNPTDKIINMSNYETIEDIEIIGNADAGINITQPLYDTLRRVYVRESGGEMKDGTDTTRQGEGIQFSNGGSYSYIGYCIVIHTYEGALTFQAHQATTAIPFISCIAEYNTTDSNECSFNPTIDVAGSGYVNCRVNNNTFKNDGYAWSQYPNGKPKNNQAITLLCNGWLCDAQHSDLILENNTYINPKRGLYFINGISSIPYVARNNEIYLNPSLYIRVSYDTTKILYNWKLADSTAFVNATGKEVGSHWHLSNGMTYNIYYRDADGDGYGNPADTVMRISAPVGYISIGRDCNDRNVNVNPGAKEICGNHIDDNCDGYVDAPGCKNNRH